MINSDCFTVRNDNDEILTWAQIRPLIGGISRQTWWRLWSHGKAPRPIAISAQRNGWLRSQINEYRASLKSR